MKVHYGFESLPALRNPVVTVGSFDGVHRGHAVLLDTLRRTAREKHGESVVVTFHPHPRTITGDRKGVSLLSTLQEKIHLLAKAGIDHLIIAPFTAEFSRVPYSDFVRKYIIEKVGAGTLVVGYNHHFGHNKEGNFSHLEILRVQYGFEAIMVPRMDVGDSKVSSTLVRDAISRGDMPEAARLLGYDYFIMASRGHDLFLYSEDDNKLLPPAGQYPVRVENRNGSYSSFLDISDSGRLALHHYDDLGIETFFRIVFI